jgi:type I restriction enzyme, S subunit
MNPQLLNYFDRVSEAPKAIPRIRGFILDLAVRGKLVEQYPTDESASELLGEIQAEKARLEKGGDIRKQESLPLSEDEEPFDIPYNWVWTRLGQVGSWGSGSTPPRGHDEFYGGGITWLKSGELNDDQELRGSEETVSESALRNGSFRRNHPGDVLIAMYGATIGKVAILAEHAVTNQAVCGCTPFVGVLNRYLFTFLLSQREHFRSASEGGAQPNISKVKLVGFPFPLPPFAEQHRIVVKVDELMALCNRLEAAQTERESRRDCLAISSLNRLNDGEDADAFREGAHFYFDHLPRLTTRPEHLKQLRQTILSLAVRGKLVPQDRNDEPASELLNCIQGQKAQLIKEKKLKRQKSLLPIEAENIPFEVPDGWIWSKADDVFLNITDGFHNTPSPVAEGRPYITAKHIRPLKIDFDNCLYVDEKNHRELFAKTRVRRGDILIVNIGAGCGTPAMVNVDFEFSFKNVAIVNLPSDMNGNYILQFLMYYRVLVFEELIKGGAQPFLGLAMLREMLIPVPPLAEQHRIVAKVEELMSLCNRLEAQLTISQIKSRRLLEAVLHEALAM